MDRKYFSMNSIARNKWVYAKKIALSVLFGSLAFFVLNACFYIPYAHAEEHADALNTSSVETAPSHPDNGWDSNKEHYYENGQQVRSQEIYDAKEKNWYWIDEDGSVARNKDVYLRSNGGKWVRYNAAGHMVKGEDYRYGGWYYFDKNTGAMAKGMTFVSSNGGKWVYYDLTSGKMQYGERFVNYDRSHTGWYHFDECTGAMTHGFYYNSSQHKWVYYDRFSGQMMYGEQYINNHWYDFDGSTGAVRYGFVYLPESQKWVFYDRRMCWMLYGEQPIDGAWYLLDLHTGAVQYGWQRFSGKTVCYNWPSGKMLYGRQNVNGATYYFNNRTGALDMRRSASLPSDYVPSVAGDFGKNIRLGKYHSVRILGDSIAAGVGAANPYPCTSRELFRLEGNVYFEPSHQTDSAVNGLIRDLKARGVSVTNASAPGKGSYSAYDSIGDQTLGHEDAAIVLLGTNDRLRLSNSNDFARTAERYLNRVSARYGSSNVYVIAGIDTLSDPRPLTMEQENNVLQSLCRQHGWWFASAYAAFRTVGRSTGMPQHALYTDGIHPNRIGQVVLRRSLEQLLGL